MTPFVLQANRPSLDKFGAVLVLPAAAALRAGPGGLKDACRVSCDSVRSMRCVFPRDWKGWVHERGDAGGLAADFFRSFVDYAVHAGPLDRQGRDDRAPGVL